VEIAVEINNVRLDEIVSLIVYYEMKEATTLFELALWKARIDQTDMSNPADRTASRIEVPGPVKDTILQYLLSSDDSEDSSSSSSSEDDSSDSDSGS